MVKSPWKLRAEGGTVGMIADPVALREALGLFADPDHGCQLVSIYRGPTGRGSATGRTLKGDDLEGLATAAGELPSGSGIYFKINPVPVGQGDRVASAKDILKRRWLFIDVDRVKSEADKNDSATDAEKDATAEVMQSVAGYLSNCGWPAPIVSDSGNGFGLFYPLDLPADKLTQASIRRLLMTLKERFDCPAGEVDDSVHNADRLAKVPGTWARKGISTDDRPHRPCKLLSVPVELVPVSMELIQAAAGTDDKPAPPATTEWKPPKGQGWGKAALVSECTRLALTAPGARDNALMKAAFRMGQVIAGGGLERADAEASLYAATCRNGLEQDAGPESIRDKIRRGIDAGIEVPRGPTPKEEPKPRFTRQEYTNPTNGDDKQTVPTATPTGAEPLTVSMSKIKPLQVEWLMRNRIPKRFITVLAGRTGIGKSFVALDLIARVSNGGEIPFAADEYFRTGGTLIMSEDSHEYVLAPRLIDAGADMNRIHAMTWKAMGTYHLGDTDMLSRACAEVPGGVGVVMIDPPTNFLEGTDEHKNSEVRQLVMRVVEWALARDVAVLFILHVNKSAKGVEALNRVMGSVAWVTTSRVAHTFCPDPEDPDRGLWVPLKNNLGPLEKAIAYRVVKGTDGATRVEWIEEVDMSADEAMGNDRPPKKKYVIASQWLAGLFANVDKLPSDAIWKARDQTTLSKDALKEAKEDMGVKARQEIDDDGNRAWWWYWPKEARDCWQERKQGSEAGTP